MTVETAGLRERLEALPGLDRLLPALDGLPPAFLVGGAVRDLLRGARAVDLDVAIEGDARAAARELARRLGGEAVEHERFGTATVRAGGIAVDLATTRRESYVRPGALPDVEPAALADDLVRRDFTINAMAAGLSGTDLGVLHDPHGGLADLEAGTVRVLHDASFTDDPTRLLRAVRYETRLGFRMDGSTERLARAAAAAGTLATVSGKRVRDELMDLLREPEAPTAVGRLAELGIAAALHPALRAEPELVASAQLACAQTEAEHGLAALAALASGDPDAVTPWVDDLQLLREERDAVLRAARRGPELATELRDDAGLRPSALRDLLATEPPESLALALALGAPAEPVLRWVAELRHVRLEISGADLLAAGVPESPALGRALEATLRRKLDGELAGRDAELAAALEEARA
jgi:tRNA nucleotidyltransferase (CCA-adding enzyme)